MTENMSGQRCEPTQGMYDYLPDTVAIKEQEGWDAYLAWCRASENGPHE